MRIPTEYMSFKNCWTISSSYHFQAHLQLSQRRWCFSQTALQWFDVLPGLSLALPGLWSALPEAPRFAVSAPSLVAGAPRCSQLHLKGHCIGSGQSGIWPPWDSGPTTLRHSQRLPATKIQFADASYASSVSNGSSFGPGGYYRSAWQRPYPIKNRRFF